VSEFPVADAVPLWGTVDSQFFEGTAVAQAAAGVLEGRNT
jgi:hypothetical protein